MIGGTTVALGASTFIAGTSISVRSSNIIVDGIIFASLTPMPMNAGLLTVAGQQIRPAPNEGIVIAGTTFPPGAQTYISGAPGIGGIWRHCHRHHNLPSSHPCSLQPLSLHMLKDEVIWGILVCRLKLDRSLSRSEQVKTLLAGPSPISPMKSKITISPISNTPLWES